MAEVEYKLDWTIEENLKMFKGKRVNLIVAGYSASGMVKDVKDGLLHLEKIVGRDFFDALIRVDKIHAVEAQFRGFNS